MKNETKSKPYPHKTGKLSTNISKQELYYYDKISKTTT